MLVWEYVCVCVSVCAQAHVCVEDSSNSFVHLVNSVVYLLHDPFASSSKKKKLQQKPFELSCQHSTSCYVTIEHVGIQMLMLIGISCSCNQDLFLTKVPHDICSAIHKPTMDQWTSHMSNVKMKKKVQLYSVVLHISVLQVFSSKGWQLKNTLFVYIIALLVLFFTFSP